MLTLSVRDNVSLLALPRARRRRASCRRAPRARRSSPRRSRELGVRTPSQETERRGALRRQPAEGAVRARAARRAARAARRRADARRRRRRPHRPLPRACARRPPRAAPSSCCPRTRSSCRASATACSCSRAGASCASSRATRSTRRTSPAPRSPPTPTTARERARRAAARSARVRRFVSGDYLPSVVLALLIVAVAALHAGATTAASSTRYNLQTHAAARERARVRQLRPARDAADRQHRPLGRAADGPRRRRLVVLLDDRPGHRRPHPRDRSR